MIKDYDWRSGRITCIWYCYCEGRKVGIFRFHSTPTIPGPYDAVVTALVNKGEYEMLGFLADPMPSTAEFKEAYAYLDTFGKRKKSDRARIR